MSKPAAFRSSPAALLPHIRRRRAREPQGRLSSYLRPWGPPAGATPHRRKSLFNLRVLHPVGAVGEVEHRWILPAGATDRLRRFTRLEFPVVLRYHIGIEP